MSKHIPISLTSMFKQFHTLSLCYATGFLKNVNGFLSEAIFGLYIFYEKMTQKDKKWKLLQEKLVTYIDYRRDTFRSNNNYMKI